MLNNLNISRVLKVKSLAPSEEIKDELKKGMTDGTDVTMERLFIVRLPNVEDHKGHSLDPLVILTII